MIFLKKSFLIHINVAKLQLDQNHKLDNFEGSLAFKDEEIINGDLNELIQNLKIEDHKSRISS